MHNLIIEEDSCIITFFNLDDEPHNVPSDEERAVAVEAVNFFLDEFVTFLQKGESNE